MRDIIHHAKLFCLSVSYHHEILISYFIIVVNILSATNSYLAPEYFMHGIISERTDVFAYGVLLLELITGRRAVDSSRQSLVMWV